MKRKHPERKQLISPLTEEQLARPLKSIDHDFCVFTLSQLKHDIARGLGCLRNTEQLLALMLNTDRQLTPMSDPKRSTAAVDNLLN